MGRKNARIGATDAKRVVGIHLYMDEALSHPCPKIFSGSTSLATLDGAQLNCGQHICIYNFHQFTAYMRNPFGTMAVHTAANLLLPLAVLVLVHSVCV